MLQCAYLEASANVKKNWPGARKIARGVAGRVLMLVDSVVVDIGSAQVHPQCGDTAVLLGHVGH